MLGSMSTRKEANLPRADVVASRRHMAHVGKREKDPAAFCVDLHAVKAWFAQEIECALCQEIDLQSKTAQTGPQLEIYYLYRISQMCSVIPSMCVTCPFSAFVIGTRAHEIKQIPTGIAGLIDMVKITSFGLVSFDLAPISRRTMFSKLGFFRLRF